MVASPSRVSATTGGLLILKNRPKDPSPPMTRRRNPTLAPEPRLAVLGSSLWRDELNGGARELRAATWRSFERLLHGSRRLIVRSLAIAVGQSLLLVPIAFLVRRAFDVTIPAGDNGELILIGSAILG